MRTRTRTKTGPNGTEADAAGRRVRACESLFNLSPDGGSSMVFRYTPGKFARIRRITRGQSYLTQAHLLRDKSALLDHRLNKTKPTKRTSATCPVAICHCHSATCLGMGLEFARDIARARCACYIYPSQFPFLCMALSSRRRHQHPQAFSKNALAWRYTHAPCFYIFSPERV